MNVNFTFVIQIIHFIIAYRIIDIFFLRPIYKLVQADEKSMTDAQQSLAEAKAKLEQAHIVKQELWHTFQSFFKDTAPNLDEAPSQEETIKGIATKTFWTDDQEDKLVHRVEQALTKEVGRVHN